MPGFKPWSLPVPTPQAKALPSELSRLDGKAVLYLSLETSFQQVLFLHNKCYFTDKSYFIIFFHTDNSYHISKKKICNVIYKNDWEINFWKNKPGPTYAKKIKFEGSKLGLGPSTNLECQTCTKFCNCGLLGSSSSSPWFQGVMKTLSFE